MQDRIPLYPGRVKMTPVAGQANTFDMVRADDPTQAGTPLNKATLLKDATAALYGLGTGAVPDDVLAELGKYKQYWWRRRVPSKPQYMEEQTDVTDSNDISGISYLGATVPVAKTISFNPDTGENIILENPESVSLESWNSVSAGIVQISKITDKAPCYIKVPNISTPVYLPAGSNTTSASGNGTMIVQYSTSARKVTFGHFESTTAIAKIVTTKLGSVPASDWQYLQSSNRSAYPDSGTQDGYEYEYLGIPFDNAVTAPKIETGSYVGTGTYGESHPNTLTFGFIPKVVIVEGTIGSYGTAIFFYGATHADGTIQTASNSNARYAVSWDGKNISWYASDSGASAGRQLNGNGSTYSYIAIG